MRRLLILGIAITAFAFSLFLMNCGPVANNGTAGNSAAKPNTPTTTPTPADLDAACTEQPHPDPGHIKAAIVYRIAHETYINGQYNDSDLNKSAFKFAINPAGVGFLMKIEGKTSLHGLIELFDVMQHFAKDTCVQRVLFVRKGESGAKDEEADQARSFNSFEWQLNCQDPSHPCPGGECLPEGQVCTKDDGNENTETNTSGSGGRNTNTSANRGTNTNR
jgi:hypothetical protein